MSRAQSIGIERKAPDYYDIALVPATELAEGDPGLIGGAPFVAPSGDAFDVDLIRDVLNRAEESVVSTGPSPALLLVTSGTVFVESSSGLVEMTTGEAAQVAGDVVITGASRAPAAFVVARIGPEVPSLDASEDSSPDGTPAPNRHPGHRSRERVCHDLGVALPDRVCRRERHRGLRRSRERSRVQPDGQRCGSRDRPSDDDGDISFTGIEPGHYTLSAEPPAEFATSRVRCRTASGDVLAARTATNQIAMLLADGDEVACTWYLVPADTSG